MKLKTFEQARKQFASLFPCGFGTPSLYGLEDNQYYWLIGDRDGYCAGPGTILRRSDGKPVACYFFDMIQLTKNMHKVGDWSKELKPFG